MTGDVTGSRMIRILACVLVLAAGLVLFAGCTGTAPGGQGQPSVAATTPSLPSYMVLVPGNDKGSVILVGRSTCPWCQKTKALLANLSVSYYWIDLNNLDQAQSNEVMSALTVCSDTSAVPILVINGQKCIVGYQEDQIREALG